MSGSEILASSDPISPLMEEQICTPDTENHLVLVMPATSSARSSTLDTGHQEKKFYMHIEDIEAPEDVLKPV